MLSDKDAFMKEFNLANHVIKPHEEYSNDIGHKLYQ